MAVIRGLDHADQSALLRINVANGPAVARLDLRELRRLANLSDLHRVAVRESAGLCMKPRPPWQ